MRVLVTGATGFIGRHLVRALHAAGHAVVSCSRSARGPAEAAVHLQHDLAAALPLPSAGPLDAVIHLAGISSVTEAEEEPLRVAQVNVQGTLATLLLAKQVGAHFVFASSQRVYAPSPKPLAEDAPKEPVDLYGLTKLLGEQYVQATSQLYGVPAVILRLFAVYGPGQRIQRGTSGVVSILAQRALAGQPLVVMSRSPKDFLEVSDAVGGILLALGHCARPAPAYNIAAGVPTTVLELAQTLRHLVGCACPILEQYPDQEPGGLVADIRRARRDLGYQPRISLEEGLKTYVSWLRD